MLTVAVRGDRHGSAPLAGAAPSTLRLQGPAVQGTPPGRQDRVRGMLLCGRYTAKIFPDKCRLRIVRKPFFVFFDNLHLNLVFNWLNMHLSDSSTMSEVDDNHSI